MQESLIVPFRNTFEGGFDTDTVTSLLKPNTYTDAQNLSLVTNGQFFSLTNMLGTTSIGNLPGISGNVTIIGIYSNNYLLTSSGTTFKGLTIFGYDSTNFKAWCFNTETNIFYQLFQEPKSAGVTNTDYIIDAVGYAEAGYDNIYFTDNYNEPRKIRCVIPNPYVANFLTSTIIGLAQRKAIFAPAGTPNTSGGSLLTGTYQLAVQFINPSINKYTRFSLLSNPIHIYTSDSPPKAGIGLPSSSYIAAGIPLTDDEYVNYTHFRVALVSNIYAEGTTIETLNSVSLSKVELISTFYVGVVANFNTVVYTIKNNVQLNTTTIDEIVTDLLALDYCKTLNIKRNRLLIGNITLKNVDYDNGSPSITGGSILSYVDGNAAIKDTFTSSFNSSNYRGHFRGEVYRYAISYFDKFGNFSSPKTLDVSSVQDNQISGTVDMKYPDRSFTTGGRTYVVLNAADQAISLGLRLTGITNHPKWAVGFIILRAKRKKNILFQTPFIPMANVYSLGAVATYPTTDFEPPPSAPVPTTHTSATPMGPGFSVMPPFLGYGALAETGTIPYLADGTVQGGYIMNGEPRHIYFVTTFNNALIYPPDSMYTKLSPQIFTGNETIKTVDMCTMFCYYNNFSLLSGLIGAAGGGYNDCTETSASLSFYSAFDTDLFYNVNSTFASTIRSSSINIKGNKFIENLGGGTSLNGASILDSSKFTTPTVPIGYNFNNQRCVVIQVPITSVVNSPATTVITFPGAITSTFSPNYLITNPLVNSPLENSGRVIHLTQFGTYPSGGIVNDPYGNNRFRSTAIEISNVLSNLPDTRYGTVDDFNEFIFTGTQVVFTPAEQITIAGGGSVVPKTVDIWGGDCFVSYHTFKISETSWSIENTKKVNDTVTVVAGPQTINEGVTLYNKVYGTPIVAGSQYPLHIPYFFKNAAQYITLPLESEFIGSVRDVDTPDIVTTTASNISIYGANTEIAARAPMGYNYNINLIKENDQKIFVPIDKNIPFVTKYKARAYYSDIKIYQTLINGFDVFRVNNYFDYEERYGGITKLALGGDNLYGIQEKSIFYIPINERVMETTDASQLAVRTSDFISQPLYLTNNKGSQHIQSVVQQGQFVICMDNINKQIYRIQGQQFDVLSDKGAISKWQSLLTSTIAENKISSFYDYLKDEYWIFQNDGSFCFIWNNDYNIWTSTVTIPSKFWGGISQNSNLYLLAQNAGTVYTMYTGPASFLFGNYLFPNVTFIINPELEHSKTFDNLLINSTNKLKTLSLSTSQDSGATQTMTNVDLTTIATRGKDNGYMLKTLRDSSNGRMRGLFSTAQLTWNSGVSIPQVGLISVVTNIRLSSKIF